MTEKAMTVMVPMQQLTIKVKLPQAFAARIWLASQLFKLGGLVAGGAKVEIE